MSKVYKTMDGNEACAYASYAFTEVAAIYPITPSSPMAEHVDTWAAHGKKNVFGSPVKLVEMESECGAISAVNGALNAGVLATSYTASQGLMLMIPTMFRIAGELQPGVVHVASRNVATNVISIFAEHSDVMSCRQTGFAMLASSSVQQAMDLGAVAHLAAIKGHVPFLHFFDGFRTSHEIQKVECLDYDELKSLIDYKELKKFRDGALNPEHPQLITTGENDDTYFQQREAVNSYYEALPDVVESCMQQINGITGRDYHLFNYYGAPDADRILVGLGSIAGTAQETVDYLRAKGEKVGYLEVHLFRPFSVKHFVDAIPATVKKITVLDRDKEAGAIGEPLYEEVVSALNDVDRKFDVVACRFGLAGKDTTPAMVVAMYDNMALPAPKNHYTIGINDDVTHHSIPYGEEIDIVPEGTISCKFWGIGSDGTVGANKNTIKIIGDHTDLNVQAYFEYDGKKSGGLTRSHLRFGKQPIRSQYYVKKADFVGCHNQSYIGRYDLTADIKDGGALLLNCEWDEKELENRLPGSMKRDIAKRHIRLYTINAVDIALNLGLGSRTNTVLQAAFFKIADIIPIDDAVKYMKDAILKSYGRKGEKIVNMNYAAVDAGVKELKEITVPASWASAEDTAAAPDERKKFHYITNILEPVNAAKGDDIPVSDFVPYAGGFFPQGTSKFEKRGTSVRVPSWDPEKCLQCNQCSFVCPHGVLRPMLLSDDEVKDAEKSLTWTDAEGKEHAGLRSKAANGKGAEGKHFHMAISVLDCTGCGSCVNVCPADGALTMSTLDAQKKEADAWDYTEKLPTSNTFGNNNVKNSQFSQPLLEFNGACPGCGETPYAKLVTQLFGDRMYIATATGCSQVWATCFPSMPYTPNKQGHGPAVGGSLFENNAEYGLGIYLADTQRRNALLAHVQNIAANAEEESLRTAAQNWVDHFDDKENARKIGEDLLAALKAYTGSAVKEDVDICLDDTDHLVKKSVWLFGGDGWAYDIGYGGLDHVVASGADVNVLIFDTEVYSNTGGQASKSTPTGAVAQFAAAGKRTKKKDLGRMIMTYGNVYVAQVAMGANMQQTLTAIREAEAYNGPSIVIAYSPCINHGLRCGMNKVQSEIKKAVEAGYWQMYRFNPDRKKEGLNPFVLDSKAPTGDFREFLRGETRFASLERTFPEAADALYEKCQEDAKERYEAYVKMAQEN
jgi:pyruvate-ferredoxin/flavodoxin oxidoreductase